MSRGIMGKCGVLQITLQERFQAKCLELWAEFKKMLIRSDSWLDKTERLVSKDSYGYTLKEAEAYVQEIKVHMVV